MLELIRAVERDRDIIHVPLCREEEGIGICAGAYLAGRKTAIIMQNAGFLNSCNALTTTSLQFQIPLLMLIYYAGDIGDRGFTTLGAVTEPVLQAMGFRSFVLRDRQAVDETLRGAQILADDSKQPRRGAADQTRSGSAMMQRYDYLRTIAGDAGDALAVCTGWAAREWWALRPGDGNLKTRTLGLVSSIAAGLAIALPHRKVIAIDGDGAFLMNLCGLPTIARQRPGNLLHLLFDNEIFEASGGTATASRDCDAVALAKGAGYEHAKWVRLAGGIPCRICASGAAQRIDFARHESRTWPTRKSSAAEARRDRKQVPFHALPGSDRETRDF